MKKSLILLFFVIVSLNSFSQSNEVLVTSSGVHANNNEAKKLALRNALEMTIGTYISSSSSIENSKLINDEVISLTRGLVKSYKVLTEIKIENEWKVVVEALISLDNTINYIQEISPQGTSVKISGGIYALNKIHRDFAKINERKIIVETLGEMHNLFEKGFDYKIRISEPQENKDKTISITYQAFINANKNIDIAANYFIDVLNNVSLELSELEQLKAQNIAFYTITFRYKNSIYLYFLRSEESIDVIRRVFNNFDYYTTKAEIQDGLRIYPLTPSSSQNYLTSLSGTREKRKQNILEITNSNSFIVNFFNPFGEDYDVLPLTLFENLKTFIMPNEWTGLSKINKKQREALLHFYQTSDVSPKNPDKINSLIDKINKNPNIFSDYYKQMGFLNENKMILENSGRLMLFGYKGKRLPIKYLNNEFFPGFSTHLFLFSSKDLAFAVTNKLNYSTDQLNKIDQISIIPLKEAFIFKNGGIQMNSRNKVSFTFSLHLGIDSYDNLSKSKFVHDGWRVPEKRHFQILEEQLKIYPYFNLYPAVFQSQYTSRLDNPKEYRFYLSKTLEVSYQNWDGKKEYGGPVLYNSNSMGSKTDKYFIIWVKE